MVGSEASVKDVAARRRWRRRAGLGVLLALATGYGLKANRLPWQAPAAQLVRPAATATLRRPEGLAALLGPDPAAARAIDPLVAYKVADGLRALGPDLPEIERASEKWGLPPTYVVSIAITETDGGRNLTPLQFQAYVKDAARTGHAVPDTVPQGLFAVTPKSLDAVVDEAKRGERYFSDLLGPRWDLAVKDGWTAADRIDRIMTPEERAKATAAFVGSTSGFHRVFGLAAFYANHRSDLASSGISREVGDLAIMTAYNENSLRSEGLPVDYATLFTTYTSGSTRTRRGFDALAEGSFDARKATQFARLAAGSNGEWYLKNSEQTMALLDAFGSLEAAQGAAERLETVRGAHKEAKRAALGTLYEWMARDPKALDRFESWYAANDSGASINDAVAAYGNATNPGTLAEGPR